MQLTVFHSYNEIFFQGPPGPPKELRVEGVSSTTSDLSWTPGSSNNSPIQEFIVQARTPFSIGWQAVSTGGCLGVRQRFAFRVCEIYGLCTVCFSVPEILSGNTHKATVAGLSPWVEYEFRVLAGNSVGIGEPSQPSELLRTKASGKKCTHV